MTTLSAYMAISKDLSKWQSIAARSATVATQTKYFQANIGSVKTAADLVKNPRLFSYAMTAYGLGDRIYAKGLMTQVLQQGASSSTALARKLNDPNVLAFAKAFDFKTSGEATTASTSLVKQVVDLYAENALETDQAKQNPGVDLALYFQRKAPSITSAFGLLADKKLLKVVQTALDISPMTGAQSIDKQAATLSKKIKFSDFQDPKKLQAFIVRFSAMYDSRFGATSASGASSTNPVLLDASGTDLGPALDQSLLQSLQTYRAQG